MSYLDKADFLNPRPLIVTLLIFVALACILAMITVLNPRPASADPGDMVLSQVEVRITITKVKALECIDEIWPAWCDDPDFYPRWTLLPFEQRGDGSYKYEDDDDEIEPNWVTPHPDDGPEPWIPITDGGVDFNIEIYDYDSGLRGYDDHVDISPSTSGLNSRDLMGRIKWNQEFTEAYFELHLQYEDSTGIETYGLSKLNPLGFGTKEGNELVFEGQESDNAEIHLKIEVLPKLSEVSTIRTIGFHSPIHPELTDELEISAGVTDEFGDPVDVDSIEIWVDPNPHDQTRDDAKRLPASDLCPGAIYIPAKTNCVVAVFKLWEIDQLPEELIDGHQRMISYAVVAKDIVHAPHGDSSGWRSLTVGNIAGESVIGFSIGNGDRRRAVDLTYAGHAEHYGAAGCGGKKVDIWAPVGSQKNPSSWAKQSPRVAYQCTTPIETSAFSKAVEKNWSNTFASHGGLEWNPGGKASLRAAYLDIFRVHHRAFNFWYTTNPAVGAEDWLTWEEGYGPTASMTQSGPTYIDYWPGTKKAKAVRTSRSEDSTIILFNPPSASWRAAMSAFGPSVAVDEDEFKTTFHELGHQPFGLADTYGEDGGHWQPSPFPNLYRKYEWWKYGDVVDIYDDTVDVLLCAGSVASLGLLGFECDIDDYVGCQDDPFLPPNHAGRPVPDSLDECREIESYWLSTGVGDWFFSPEPLHSLMGKHDPTIILPDGTKGRSQGAPQTTRRIEWYIGRCTSGGDC